MKKFIMIVGILILILEISFPCSQAQNMSPNIKQRKIKILTHDLQQVRRGIIQHEQAYVLFLKTQRASAIWTPIAKMSKAAVKILTIPLSPAASTAIGGGFDVYEYSLSNKGIINTLSRSFPGTSASTGSTYLKMRGYTTGKVLGNTATFISALDDLSGIVKERNYYSKINSKFLLERSRMEMKFTRIKSEIKAINNNTSSVSNLNTPINKLSQIKTNTNLSSRIIDNTYLTKYGQMPTPMERRLEANFPRIKTGQLWRDVPKTAQIKFNNVVFPYSKEAAQARNRERLGNLFNLRKLSQPGYRPISGTNRNKWTNTSSVSNTYRTSGPPPNLDILKNPSSYYKLSQPASNTNLSSTTVNSYINSSSTRSQKVSRSLDAWQAGYRPIPETNWNKWTYNKTPGISNTYKSTPKISNTYRGTSGISNIRR